MDREDEVRTRLIIWDAHYRPLYRFNLGRGRHVPPHPLFHESVKTRMEHPLLNYSPRAQYKKGTETYVS